jgi:hypothetical protein
MIDELGVLRVNETAPGLFSLILPPCTARILGGILAAEVPFVIIEDHPIHRSLEWIDAMMPLSDVSLMRPICLSVRDVRMDVALETTRFLENLAEFESFGLSLYQLGRRPANTLRFADVTDRRLRAALYREADVHLAFHLPHPSENASLSAPIRETVQRVVDKWNSLNRL